MAKRDQSSSRDGPGEIVVFQVRRETACGECGEALGPGRMIRLVGDKALCLECADLDHLEFLASGDAAVTRRANKQSRLSAVVVRWCAPSQLRRFASLQAAPRRSGS